jgi:hypothetical protein
MSKTQSDIVERLRLCETHVMWADHAEIPKRWCKEAADEIERLRAALSGLIKCADAGFWPEDEELEAARAALKEQT